MLKLQHNKKRNVGLVFEFFSRYIGRAIIEDRDEDIRKAKALIAKHYNNGTDIQKEYLCFKSLFETKVTNKESAIKLMEQIKSKIKLQSQQKLDLEKTSLIHEINQMLPNSERFFNENVKNYKLYATIQILLNEWRNEDLLSLQETFSGGSILQLEDQVLTHLTTLQEVHNLSEEKQTLQEKMQTTNVDDLIVNIISDKINENFSSSLSEEQKELIKYYVCSAEDSKQQDNLFNLLKETKGYFYGLLETRLNLFSSEEQEKLKKLKTMMESSMDLSLISPTLSEETVVFYLGLLELKTQLMAKG